MSKSKNNGIKKGSAAHRQRQLDLNRRNEENDQLQRDLGQCIEEQIILLALCEMGFRAKQFYELQEWVTKIRVDKSLELMGEYKDDHQFWHLKEAFDRDLFACLPDSMHKSWEQRFDMTRHTLGLRVGPADNIPEEMEEYRKAYAEYLAERQMAKHKRELKRSGTCSEQQ